MNAPSTATGTWRDERLEPGRRAELLLREMTTAEKCHQLTARMSWSLVKADGSDADGAAQVYQNPPGHIAQLILDDPAQLSAMVGAIQRQVMTRTRLGIPVLFHAEALSGFLAGGHMVFPSGTGLAAGWSPDLVEEMADLIRRQMRRTGLMHALSPVLDITLDPRWGRVHETFGEDPYLAAVLGVAYVRGLQGQDLAHGVIATGKHFLGYAAPQGGLNTAAFEAGARRTRDLFGYPFEAAIRLAGLRSVMNSYADVDGVPAGASREVLTDLLRDTLGFDGFVSSDYGTLEHLVHRQRVATNAAEAGRLGISAGLDVELPKPYGYGDVLAAEVERGAVDIRQVDRSVWRVLRAKFELGLFEHPYPTERIDVAAAAGEGRRLSLELARRSVVLVKNDGILPLETGALRVAVIGPHADAPSLQFPTYTYLAWRQANEAIRRGELGTMLGADDDAGAWYNALFAPTDGHTLVRERHGASSLAEEVGVHAPDVRAEPGCTLTGDLDQPAIDAAVTAARDADVAVLALGGASLWFTGERTEGEASDTADIALPAAQERLAEAVAAAGTPLVVVLVQGRAYAVPDVIRRAAAIVVAPYAGPFGNPAIAEVLFGVVNPSGKMPYSVPRHGGQIPVYHHQKAGTGYRNPLPPGVTRHYLDLEATPLWPFGHGLSYTDFTLSDLECGSEIGTDGLARIGATVTNTGSRDGAAVVQLYLRLNTSLVTRPAQQLAGFARVELTPGERRRVVFEVDASQLAYTNSAGTVAVEPARVDVFVGLDAHDRALKGALRCGGRAAGRGGSCPVLLLRHRGRADGLPMTERSMYIARPWLTAEIAFESDRDRPSPYLNVDARVVFSGPDGDVIRRPAFWDGGRTWRIRFAPTRPGTWRYRVTSGDPTDRGLNGATGQVVCGDEESDHPFAHGFLRSGADGHYLAHADGTPFFWLGDTHWRFGWERWDESNKPGWPSQFRGMVDRRVEQGFTVYQTNLMSFGEPSVPSPCWATGREFTEVNTEYFRSTLDRRMAYIAGHGLLNAVGLGWYAAIDADVGGMARFARYVVARYGSFPIVWTLGGEVAGYDADRRQARINGWRQVALAIRDADDYDHPRTAHLTAERPIPSYYQGEEWLSLTMNQHGHGDVDLDTVHYRDHLAAHPGTPLVEGESMYEGLISVEYAARRPVTDTMVRQVAYRAIQSGCCGYTYGAQGCWNAAWDREDAASTWGDLPWHEGIDLPGADHLGHLRRFYESLDWTALRPDSECFATENPFNASLYRPNVTADQQRRTIVAFFPEAYRRGGGRALMRGLATEPYRVEWFDPRTGGFRLIDDRAQADGGILVVPDKPDDGDWVLLARSRAGL